MALQENCDRWSIWHLCVKPRTRRKRWRQRRRHRLLLMKLIDKVTKWTACYSMFRPFQSLFALQGSIEIVNLHIITSFFCVSPRFLICPPPPAPSFLWVGGLEIPRTRRIRRSPTLPHCQFRSEQSKSELQKGSIVSLFSVDRILRLEKREKVISFNICFIQHFPLDDAEPC